jgi:hypothetical protein
MAPIYIKTEDLKKNLYGIQRQTKLGLTFNVEFFFSNSLKKSMFEVEGQEQKLDLPKAPEGYHGGAFDKSE